MLNRVAIFCAVFLLPSLARATVVMDLTGPELAAISDAIVHARVAKISGHITAQTRVFTDAELEVIDGLKGVPTGARIQVSYPGGTWQGLGMLVSGQVSLREGAECVLYLQRQKDGDGYIPSGMRLGWYDVEPRANDGVRVAKMSTEGLTLVRRQRVLGRFETVVRDARQVARPLDVLKVDIKKDLDAARTLSKEAILGGQR